MSSFICLTLTICLLPSLFDCKDMIIGRVSDKDVAAIRDINNQVNQNVEKQAAIGEYDDAMLSDAVNSKSQQHQYRLDFEDFPFDGFVDRCASSMIASNLVLTGARCVQYKGEIQKASALHVTAMERYPIYNQRGKLLNPQNEFNSTRNVTKFYLLKENVPIIKECFANQKLSGNSGNSIDTTLQSAICDPHDIAILVLESDMPIGTILNPDIILPLIDPNMSTESAISAANECHVVGYFSGVNRTGESGTLDDYMQEINVTGLLEYRRLPQIRSIISAEIFKNQQVFNGNPGGPLICRINNRWHQVGITTSFVRFKDEKQFPPTHMFFSTIEKNRPFIDEIMKNVASGDFSFEKENDKILTVYG